MAPPPAKRQKRLIIFSSDEEDDRSTDISNNHPESRASAAVKRVKTTAQKSVGRPSQTSLPTRTRAKLKPPTRPRDSASSNGNTPASSPAKSKSKPGSIYSFFNTVTQSQQVTYLPEASTPVQEVEEDDLIEDDSHDDRPTKHLSSQDNLRELGVGKKFGTAKVQDNISDDRLGLNGVKKFLSTPTTKSKRIAAGESARQEDTRPWAEQFPPLNLEELAVHKRKSEEVKIWLDNVINGKDRKRLLVLKGPSGSGKTATISALSKLMDFGVVEWNNPISADYSSEGFRSISAQFEDFLERSGKFNALTLESTSATCTGTTYDTPSLPDMPHQKKVILLEEFPNTFSRTSSPLLSFRSNVLHYLSANTPSPEDFFKRRQDVEEDVIPLIMIISETQSTTTSSSADSFTAHRLLGPNILNHPGTTMIDFNPVAPTIIIKALQLVAQKEARRSGRRRTPGDAVLKKLGEVGDIRSAISSLEFLCLGKGDDADWSGRIAAKSKKGRKDGLAMTKIEHESIEAVTQREASLGIFHAVGKVVYNKREEVNDPEPHVQPPDHLEHHSRPMVSQVKVEELMDETGTDTSTFIAALHENYALSCVGPNSTDALNGCIDALSDSDLLSPDRPTGFTLREGPIRGIYSGSDSENLRQNEICFHVAVRGMLFALPYPIKRTSGGVGRVGGKGDAFKMYYPTSMRLWKQKEEIESLIEGWTDALNAQMVQPGRSRGVDMWKNRFQASSVQTPSLVEADTSTLGHLFMRGNSARTEMILERLPFIAKIERIRSPYSSRHRELEKMTTFHGVGVPTQTEPDEDGEGTAPNLTVPAIGHRSTGEEKVSSSYGFASQTEGALEKLVLSDDDIEDD